MNRVKAGYLLVKNPFNTNQIRRVSLLPSDVDAIVFWTRNPSKLMPYIHELDCRGFKYYFQYTITGYPRSLEKSVPHPLKSIETFCHLSDLLSPSRVIWRYDPILLSNFVGMDEHKRRFERIATALNGKTKRVVISFADLYNKTNRNLNMVEGLSYTNILEDNVSLRELVNYVSSIAKSFGMEVQTCSEAIDLSSYGVVPGKCIDDDLLKTVFGIDVCHAKDPGQREACGCIKSVDIGQYNTCLHGCTYCYATFNAKLAAKSWEKHDPDSPFLVGPPPEDSGMVEECRKPNEQQSLF